MKRLDTDAIKNGIKQSKANAHLIAAAPEMLEALELIWADLRMVGALTRDQRNLVYRAILKSRGEL